MSGNGSSGRRILIVGGGVSGLSAAWFLHRRGCRVRVLEAAARVGGSITTERKDGYQVERGPNTTLQRPGREEDAIGRLVSQLGLDDRLLEANPAGKKRFVLRDGRLHALPGSPPAFLATPLFSWRAKLRLLKEPFIGRGKTEETIAEFVERRLGREFLDYAVDPFVSGVYAGTPRELSAWAAVPRIHEIESRYGSLIRGAIALGKAAKGAGMPAGRQISFDAGMAVLPETIVAKLPEGSVATGRRATEIVPSGEGWEVAWVGSDDGRGRERGDALVIALPAAATADLVAPLSETAARALRGIDHAPVVSVGLGYARAQIAHALDGFGFLAPRPEDMRSLGGLFSSTLFPGRAPRDHALITGFVGGTTDRGAVTLGDEEVFGLLAADLATALGIDGAPVFRSLTRYDAAIPQYTLGHLDRVEEVDRALDGHAKLFLRASWRGGISVADCVRNGEKLSERMVNFFEEDART